MCKLRPLFTTFIAALSLAAASQAHAVKEVVVYSARNEQLLRPLFEAYNRKTGVQISFITDKEGPLLERLKAEGANTEADMLMTVDAGNLWQAAQEQLLQPVESSKLEKNIPAHLRDPAKQWFGLSVRARTLVYNTQRVKPTELSTYEALAEPVWSKRLCLRTSKKVYNQSLVAMLMGVHGEAATEQLVKGWVANLAADPFADDTKALEAVAAGICDVTLVNTYYFGRLMKEKPALPLAIFWPNQQAGKGLDGVHVNISGAGITRHAKHPEQARKLLEWLSSAEAQNLYADENLEYPANPEVKPAAAVAAWGNFKASQRNLAEAGEKQAQAVMLMDRAGYQ